MSREMCIRDREDSMYKCICDYARKHKMTVTEVVLQGLEKVLNRPE